ncbi:MAG TPA: hypothetical protein VGR43_11635, partial [Dehalococcoidia bacterium]|nr:hypothetical protein [Dehalococcoidia bacterium]
MAWRGPNTQRGKAASSRNAVTHGISSDSPLVPGESPPEWQRHLTGIRDSLQPANYLMEELALLIALGLWRRRRIDRYEVEAVTAHMAAAKEDLQTLQAYREGTLAKGTLPEIPP